MDRSTLRELSSRVHLKAFRDVPPNDIIPFFRRGTRKEIVLFTSVPRPLERRACTTSGPLFLFFIFLHNEKCKMALATTQESKGQKPYQRGELKNSNGPTGMSEETLLFVRRLREFAKSRRRF
ncbi:hypothetical protein TNIN_311941 [Trichonephila inaurata madagascariensis]|uniref:Uncharacterized protein n=1 Tax=Trichonephila inaurata madagascariensis TaxID=2747483 RepID=A0A8X6MCQ0_9ARAC|nr:hypothetical protein TNIN_311941 [Trichonephila inaurata madagascariensis]